MRLVPLLLTALVVFGAAHLGAANLAPNPGFDADVHDWSPSLGAEIFWRAADEADSLLSGSVMVRSEGNNAFAWTCVPVTPGTFYAFGASALLPEDGSSDNHEAFSRVRWYGLPGCGGGSLGSVTGEARVDIPDAWGTIEGWIQAPGGAASMQLLLWTTRTGGAGDMVAFFDNAFMVNDVTCHPTATALCLNNDRFLVTSQWETPSGDVGFGTAVVLTDDSGYFWFFDSANVELVTKLLDACGTAFHTYWFFAAGLTNVYTRIQVDDTRVPAQRVYENPLDMPFDAIQDTDAFDTCPMIGG